MLTAAIASYDAKAAAQLSASLQQTGLVSTVNQWILPGSKIESIAAIPDIVLLDLGRDHDQYFAFGSQLRRMRPAMRLIACTAVNPPSSELLLAAMHSGVQDFVYKPVTPAALKDILARFHDEGVATEDKSAEKLIVVMGSKGGVGATTVAVNLGVQLSTFAKKNTALMDLARPVGNAHLLLDLIPRFGIRDAIENIDRLDSHFLGGLLTVHKTKLALLGGALHPDQWESVPTVLLDRVANVAQANFDVVLADVGSQFGSDWAPMLRASRMVLVVAETNVPALWNLERRLLAMEGMGIDQEKVRIVINRWHKGDQETLKGIEKNLKRPMFALIPNDFRKASHSMNVGIPLIENHNALTSQYQELAAQLSGLTAVAGAKKSGVGTFFSLTPKRST